MVAYSFQREFIEPTWSGRKRHTIRAVGKRRHARPGDKVQHYVGMRTKQCRLFARSVCDVTLPIRLTFSRKPSEDFVQIEGKPVISGADLDAFAQSDGFESWAAMRVFWKVKHGNSAWFDGVIVYWKDMERADG